MNIAPDKKLHIIAGAGIAFVCYFFAVYVPMVIPPVLFAGGMASFIGAAKEWIYDKHVPNHTVDRMDFLYTAAAGWVTAVVTHIIHTSL